MKKILTIVLAIMMGCMVASTAFAGKCNDGGISPVPLPASAWLFGSGLIGLAGFTRRQQRKRRDK